MPVVPWRGSFVLPGLTNANLTQVHAAGSGSDYDRDPTPGALKWTGLAGVAWSEMEERVTTGAGSNIVIRRSFVAAEGLKVDWQQNDVVSVTLEDGRDVTGTVKHIKTTGAALGVPGTIRIILDDA